MASREDLVWAARRGFYALLGFIGYILSPASWWNDAVVNIPLALVLARITAHFTGLGLEVLFAFYYWLSNVAGMVLMGIGFEGARRGGLSRKSLLSGILIGTGYTLLVVLALRLLGLG